ncbi:MFS general substrate transporter [Rhizodiscina lignyota]|uniref:MFS general substrate transporter n=1 Tax=Rhizodiscina lignyota TaxID=1504668 RepID=A0A9P4IM91_9PEZI|nr:MFS general substrate transporter [Rhizodiscina lignyota]
MALLQDIKTIPRDFADALRMKPVQYLVWFCCWACWTLGSLDFYLLPFTTTNMATAFKVKQTKISEANTTSMLSRTIGALIFGIASDQYGRKIPLLIDLVVMGAVTLANGFLTTYSQLVGVRFLFGVCYGGTYGLAMAAVLEATPQKARGIVAGSTQQGFAAGYLFASGLHLAMSKYKWQALFWLGAGLTIPVFIIRLVTPSYSVVAEAVRDAEGIQRVTEAAAVGGELSFWKKFKFVARRHWAVFIYAIVLTACFNTTGHGSMDLYPTFLVTQKKLSVLHETWVTCILQIGGISGGIVGGFLSNRFSPRWVGATAALAMAPWLPLWCLPKTWNLLALGAFFFQFFYGCAIGNLGNIMQQLCPHPGIRGAFTGVAYNLGNAISSIAPTIETALGERFPTADGTPDYAKTQMILVGIVIALLSLTLACMPTGNINRYWDKEDPNAEIPIHEAKTMDDMAIEPQPREGHNAPYGDKKADEIEQVEEVQLQDMKKV